MQFDYPSQTDAVNTRFFDSTNIPEHKKWPVWKSPCITALEAVAEVPRYLLYDIRFDLCYEDKTLKHTKRLVIQ